MSSEAPNSTELPAASSAGVAGRWVTLKGTTGAAQGERGYRLVTSGESQFRMVQGSGSGLEVHGSWTVTTSGCGRRVILPGGRRLQGRRPATSAFNSGAVFATLTPWTG